MFKSQGWTDHSSHVGSSLDHRSRSKRGPVVGGISTEERRTNMLLHSSKPAERFDTHFSSGRSKTKDPSLLISMVKGAQRKLLVRFTAREGQIIGFFGKRFQTPSRCMTPWPQSRLAQVVKRTQHDTEEEILYQKSDVCTPRHPSSRVQTILQHEEAGRNQVTSHEETRCKIHRKTMNHPGNW